MYISLGIHSSAQVFQDWHKMSEVESETPSIHWNKKSSLWDFEDEKLCSILHTLIHSH